MHGSQIDQPAGPRYRRMIRYRSSQSHSDKFSQAQRIGTAPRHATLGIDSFEIADQLHSEVDAWRQPRSAHRLGIEALACLLGKIVKTVFGQNLVHAVVKHMTCRSRQLLGRQPHRLLPMPLSSSDRHFASSGTYHLCAPDTLGLLTVMKLTLTTGC